MNTIVFIRHGETDMAGRFCGHSDPDLNPAGASQARCLAEQAAVLGIERIYSSDLRRASQTAMAIAQRIGVDVVYLPALKEIHFGLWEGLNWQEIEERFPGEAERWLREFPLHRAPGGESYAEFTARIDSVIAPFLETTAATTTAIVTHRGVMRYALTRLFSISEQEAWEKTAPYCATVVVTARTRNCEVLS
ncbi:MAG: histidine phosphatase family protein [Terracidiphilus sp.]|jgi:alpha-ribazole phosphatase/probable phosphoglycerate mutase